MGRYNEEFYTPTVKFISIKTQFMNITSLLLTRDT